MNDEFENALAWFTAAPRGWIESGRRNLGAGAQWVWEVIQGDFNDNASTAQVATGTVISMIPFVDQLCDVRDLVANCRRIDDEPDESWPWLSLSLTLIGLFPSLGSLFKGCLKVIFASTRKVAAKSGATPVTELAIGASLAQLRKFLNRADVAAALRALRWDNPFKTIAAQLKKTASRLQVAALTRAFDSASDAAKSLIGIVQRWGGSELANKAHAMLESLAAVEQKVDKKLGEALGPVREFLTRLARRLEIEADMAHRAYLNSVNPHAFKALASELDEAKAFGRAKPDWVDISNRVEFPEISSPPAALHGWPDVKCHNTFHSMRAATIPPGTTLYRIVDPRSRDNSICWMSEAEFKKLKSKSEWRRRFAVWAHWNSNGEYVTYTVPPGPGLNVWKGTTASQKLNGSDYVLQGGAEQIVLDPGHLEKAHLGKRKKTGWGYDDLGTKNDLIGVPVLRNHTQ